MSLQVKPIPAGTSHAWTIEQAVNHFRASNPSFGILSFGLRPEGPNSVGWAWKELGGGGVGVVLWSVLYEQLYIGMLYEKRPMLPTGYCWNIPRGFLEPGKTHLESAKKELKEEIGPEAPNQLIQLLGAPYNPNSTFFDTSDGGGAKFFECRVSAEALVQTPRPQNFMHYVQPVHEGYEFREGLFRASSKLGEKIIKCNFFPWHSVAASEDGYSCAGFARLIATHPELQKHLRLEYDAS